MNHHASAFATVILLSALAACEGARPAARPPAPIADVALHPPDTNVGPPPTRMGGDVPSRAVTIDLRANPRTQYRVDSFSVPEMSRAEFVKTMQENAALLSSLAGFQGHVVFEKSSGPTTFNIVTVAAWASPEAMKSAGERVHAEYQRSGFDMQGAMARWGVTASIGSYEAPAALQDLSSLDAGARPFTIDPRMSPNPQFRVDAFSVPAASRAEFVKTMQENAALLATLPGFKGHVVFEKKSGPTPFNIVTLAAWESADAMKGAGDTVRAGYQRTGFDMQGAMAHWGVTASIGAYGAPLALQQ